MPWEVSQGFISMRSIYEELSNEFENLSSEEEFELFKTQNRNWIEYSDGGWQVKRFINKPIMNLVAPDGTVEVAGALYKYTPDRIFIVMDKDEDKMTSVFQNNKADEENGVYIIEGWRKSETEIDFRGDCATTPKQMGCTASEISDKRVIGNWEVFLSASPNRNQIGQATSWVISYHWDIEIKGQERGWWGRWKRNPTRLGFVSGFGVFSSFFSSSIATGTGWTVNSNVSSIDHTFRILGPRTTSTATIPSSVGTFSITYCTCGAKDANVANLFCYDCCPWDCSDIGYDFF